jgi:GntR family transcriptional regulator/MocR family aminotransferase
MPKRAKVVERPAIALDADSAVPLYKQIYERLRGAILSGQLDRGARLPSTRALASELGISRYTTAFAYEQLLLEGYLESRIGQGTRVARQLPAPLRDTTGPERDRPAGAPATHVAERVPLLQDVGYPDRVAEHAGGTFQSGVPALGLFPYEIWARLIARRARQALAEQAHYQSPAGYEPLRAAIAAHIGITRGVRCTPDQVIITAGSQGALDLAIRTLLNTGEAAWVENPGYFGAQGALHAAGARLVPVPVDAEGLDVAIGRQRCPTARLVSATPSHQFPTGVTLSLGRRLALLEWAKQAGAWILEDDYDSEYRFSGRPLESLQRLDGSGRVLYIGTFSKTLFPALRLGYLVPPAELVEPLLATRRFVDVHAPILEQMALADFMHEGHFVRHLRHMLQHYGERRDLLCQELRAHLGGLLEVHAPEAGMHLAGWLPPGLHDTRAAELAAQAGVSVTPISKYALEPLPRGGLLFGYAGTEAGAIRDGVRRLARALQNGDAAAKYLSEASFSRHSNVL